MNRKNILCALTMCLVSVSALAMPSHGVVVKDSTNEFGASQAFVTSIVYELGPVAAGYLYTYQVSGSKENFTWFSVAMKPGTSINDYGWDLPGIGLFAWEPVENKDNPTSIEAFFKKGLTSEKSALLWFTSSYAPGNSLGALAKMSSPTGGAYAEGDVWAPQVPEPMTMALLGFGMLAVRSIKRK